MYTECNVDTYIYIYLMHIFAVRVLHQSSDWHVDEHPVSVCPFWKHFQQNSDPGHEHASAVLLELLEVPHFLRLEDPS